jgi:hypothetical protein
MVGKSLRKSLAIRKTSVCAGKTSDEAPGILSLAGSRRQRRLDGVLAKALGRQVTGRPGSRSASLHDSPGPFELRGQSGNRGLHDLLSEALPLQVVPDGRVAVSPLRQCRRPGPCEAVVVYEPGPSQDVERLRQGGRRDRSTLKPFGEPAFGEVAPAQRVGRNPERFDPPQFSPKETEARAIERAAFRQPGADGHVDRDAPPGSAVQLDLHTPTPIGPQGRDRGHYVCPCQ